jgi:hypothetical protein
MIEMQAGFHIKAPAADVWSLVNWGGTERLCGKAYFKTASYSTKEPIIGATRRHGGAFFGALDIVEVLLSYDEGRRRYTYGVLDMGDLPAGDYEGAICVTPAGPNACVLAFSSRFVLAGMSVAEFQKLYDEAEQRMADAVIEVLGCPR